MINSRYLAADIIAKVMQGDSLANNLEPVLMRLSELRDRAFLQAMCYGVCRYYSTLQFIVKQLLKKPLKAKDQDLYALLLVGVYQLKIMQLPPHAAVSETVNAVDDFKKSWARPLINGVLREYLRCQVEMEKKIAATPEAFYAHPTWWIDKIKKAWPEHWQNILLANNEHPPFMLRVNQQKISRQQYLAKLSQQDFVAEIIPETMNGLMLKNPVSVRELPGFFGGEVSVQDGAAQLAAPLLQLKPGLSVLDACAAPGGKLTHILELQPNLAKIVALEKDAERIQSIQENIQRLNLSTKHLHCLVADATAINQWWDGQLFDRILLDAPCSSSGVIRRHPDIKLLRRPSDIAMLSSLQAQLLTSLWPLLKPGGLLVYATCSIFPSENEHVVQAFLAAQPDATEEKITENWGIASDVGKQILPGMHHMDGFYYAILRKTANG